MTNASITPKKPRGRNGGRKPASDAGPYSYSIRTRITEQDGHSMAAGRGRRASRNRKCSAGQSRPTCAKNSLHDAARQENAPGSEFRTGRVLIHQDFILDRSQEAVFWLPVGRRIRNVTVLIGYLVAFVSTVRVGIPFYRLEPPIPGHGGDNPGVMEAAF